MVYRNFRHYLRKTASGEVLRHAKRRVFPVCTNHRQLRLYLNSQYKGKYLPNDLIKEFEELLDKYEGLKVGVQNG